MVEYLLRDREVLGSITLGAKSHQISKVELTATLCDTPHIKSLSKGNNASAYATVGLRLTILQIQLNSVPILDPGRNVIEKEMGSSSMLVDNGQTIKNY